MPGWGGSVFTNKRRCTSARASLGIGGSNATVTGIAVPYVRSPAKYKVLTMAGLDDLGCVVNVVRRVTVFPESPVAVTSAVYVRFGSSVRLGTQPLPSSRGSAATAAPLSSVIRTAVTRPCLTTVPISPVTGTSRVPSAGVTDSSGFARASAGCPVLRSPVHAPSASGAAATLTANSVSRRLNIMMRPPVIAASSAHSCQLGTDVSVVSTKSRKNCPERLFP